MGRTAKIKFRGRLDKKWKECFEGLDISYEAEDTILSGDIKDEAFMHGILNRIRDLNLRLISVQTSEDDPN